MHAWHALRQNRRGATLVLMAISIFLALGMAALAIDYGMIKSAKAEAQRAMDAAALAGASAFLIADPTAKKDSIARARAHEFATKHYVRLKQITDAEMDPEVQVDLVKFTVKANWKRTDLNLWFANVFGTSTMGLTATATARAVDAGTTRCVMPAALPDLWNNVDKVTSIKNKSVPEDPNNNNLWDYTDVAGGNSSDPNLPGVVDPGEWEPWEFDPGVDIYDSTSTGFGTSYRNGLDSRVKDYGRQILVQAFDPLDAPVQSFFHTWGEKSSALGVDSMRAAIKGERCQSGAVDTPYDQGNGAKVDLQQAWMDLIAEDQDATWDDASKTVINSKYGDKWLDRSPRVVIVGLYDPKYALAPQSNKISMTNFGKIWIDQRICKTSACKRPITARFLGYVEGGAGGPTTGPLVKRLVLIK